MTAHDIFHINEFHINEVCEFCLANFLYFLLVKIYVREFSLGRFYVGEFSVV